MAAVELQQAFKWTCPNCGKIQYVDPVPMELNLEEAIDAAREFGGTVAQAMSAWTTAPEYVTCEACEEDFGCEDD